MGKETGDLRHGNLDLADRIVQAAVECRGVIKEAHEVTRDLHIAVKEAKDLIKQCTKEEVGELIDDTVVKELTIMGERIKEEMDRSVDKVGKEFEKLAKIYLEPDDRDSIHTLAMKHKARKSLDL